jgi:hypothetical protein
MALLDRVTKAGTPVSQEMVPIPGSQIDALPKPKAFGEVGVSGLLRTRGVGYIYEEWLAALSTHRAKQVFREMRDNDAVIGSLFFALEMILRKAEWRIEPAKGSKGDDYAEFLKQCMEDMSHTWEDFVAEVVSMFAFGFALFEIVYKRRKGPDGRQASKYDDGMVGWRKFAPRAQESILYWIWDDEGGLQGAVQLAAPDYKTIPIPIERLLLFRTTSLKNNPEGRSILRNCYRPWFFKRRVEEVEGIGIERDLCGIPVLYASAETLASLGAGDPNVGMQRAKQLVTNLRIDDQAGVILPLSYDENKNPMVKLELLHSGGSKQSHAGDTIKRYNEDILNTMLAGFIQFGQTQHGSKSMHISATAIFTLAISAFMDSVAAIVNRIALPRLMTLNNMDTEYTPKLMAGEVGVRDLAELADFVSKLSQSGLTFFDKPTSDYLRKTGGLPATPEEPDVGAPPPEASDPYAYYEQEPPGAASGAPGAPGGSPPTGAPAPAGGPPQQQQPAASHDLSTPAEPGKQVSTPPPTKQQAQQNVRQGA